MLRFSPLCPELFVTEDGDVFRYGLRRLNQHIDTNGHFFVSTTINKKRFYFRVHRLVASAYCRGYLPGLTVNHMDGNKLNNHASNLEWVTSEENIGHAFRTGIFGFSDQAFHRAKLTAEQVKDIRSRIALGERNVDIAKLFHVDPSNISAIRRGKTWVRKKRPATALGYE